jgi:hypothetical protein
LRVVSKQVTKRDKQATKQATKINLPTREYMKQANDLMLMMIRMRMSNKATSAGE